MVIQNVARLPLTRTAVYATVAGCAAIGLVYLLPAPDSVSVYAMPVLATVLTSVLVLGSEPSAPTAPRGEALERAMFDRTTGLPTYVLAQRALDVEFAAAQRGRALTVILFNIDSLPKYAARHGGPATTLLLNSAGRVLKRRTRGMHTSARYGSGSGTFISVVSDVPLEGACTFVVRTRKELSALGRGGEPVVVSAGVAAYDLSMTSPAELIAKAERALAKATAGGGKVVVMSATATTDA